MGDCINCKKCDWCRKDANKTQSRVKDIKHLLIDIKGILQTNTTNNNMNSKDLLQETRIKELETELQLYTVNYERAKTEAETWKEAYKFLAGGINDGKIGKLERTPFKSEKTIAENFEEGENHAEFFLKSNNIEDLENQLSGGIGVQNAVLAGVAAWLREKVVETIVGYLTRLLKENAVKVVDWLLGQTEGKIIDGYMKLNNDDKFLFKNQLKKYPRFSELLNKIEGMEK